MAAPTLYSGFNVQVNENGHNGITLFIEQPCISRSNWSRYAWLFNEEGGTLGCLWQYMLCVSPMIGRFAFMAAGVQAPSDELFFREDFGDISTLINGQMACQDSKVHGANMGPTCVLTAPGGPRVGFTNLAICVCNVTDEGKLSSRKCNSWPQKTYIFRKVCMF